MDCLFCKIVSGEVPSQRVYEDDKIIAFNDIAPAAPVHILIIPKRHIDGADAAESGDAELIGGMVIAAAKIADKMKLDNGWRLITNVKEDGGQTVRHLHFHLLGGQKLGTRLC